MNAYPEIVVEDPHTKVRTTALGTILIVRRVDDTPHFFIRASVQSGSLLDKVPGTAHYFEHLPFQATENFRNNSMDTHMKSLGGSVDAHTAYNCTNYEGYALNEHMDQVILAVSDLACRPAFGIKEFNHEKGVIFAEEARRDYKGYDDPQRLLQATLGADAPHLVSGGPEGIKAVSYDNVWQFNRDNYFAQRLVVYAQGNQDLDGTLDKLEEYFVLPDGSSAVLPDYNFLTDTKVFPSDKKATQGTLVFQNYSSEALARQQLAARIMTSMLLDYRGPIYERVRHQQPLTYGVEVMAPLNPGKMQMGGPSFIVFPENVKPTIDGIISGIMDFVNRPDEKVFEIKKQEYLTQQKEGLQRNPYYSPDQILTSVINWKRIPPREEGLSIAAALTLDEVVQTARQNLFQAGVLYEGNIKDGFPDQAYVNSALRSIAPKRTAQTDHSIASRNLGSVTTYKL